MSEAPVAFMKPWMLNGLTKIEEDWHRYGRFIVPEGFNYKEAYANEAFRRGLKNRGIEAPRTAGPVGLSEEQLAAILTVLNWEDKRSRARKLDDLGVKAATWNGWMKQPEFRDYVMELTVNQFQDALPVAHESMIKAMDKGSVEAVKLYMELTGRSTQPDLVNVRLLITKLIESIQMHVKDPATLFAIQSDFEKIIKGEPVTTPKELGLI